MQAKPNGFTVLGIYDAYGICHLASVQGKVIIFDTPEQARSYVGEFAKDRLLCWQDREHEQAYFLPLVEKGINRIDLITDWDVYHTPAGTVPSETPYKGFKHHIHGVYLFHDCGQLVPDGRGGYRNLAVEGA